MSAGLSAPPTPSAVQQDPVAELWQGRRQCRLVGSPEGLDAAGHSALGETLLRAAAGDGVDRIRVYHPPRTAAFSGLDRLSPGYVRAQEIAVEHGFAPLRRGPGGRMAAYHPDSLCIDIVLAEGPTSPTLDPWVGLGALAEVLATLLRGCGIDARAGQVEGEYCPGRFSVNVGGLVKLAGTAARRIRGATLLSAVLVVDDMEPLRAVTTDVYAALDFPFVPATLGGAARYAPGLSARFLGREFLGLQADRIEVVKDDVRPPASQTISDVPPTDRRRSSSAKENS